MPRKESTKRKRSSAKGEDIETSFEAINRLALALLIPTLSPFALSSLSSLFSSAFTVLYSEKIKEETRGGPRVLSFLPFLFFLFPPKLIHAGTRVYSIKWLSL